ncbi:hypothetical protein CPT76_14525 [Paenibacillus sp. AR247]|nr:hypothetical protein CPT76_14525 [Paenibacillus sp. AR247]
MLRQHGKGTPMRAMSHILSGIHPPNEVHTVKQLEKLLKKTAVSRPSKTTSRQIVVFKTQQDYRQCLDILNANGIKPVKAVDSHRLICCHFHRSTDMEKIKQHPRVAYVQRDAKVKAHAIKPAAAAKRGGANKATKKSALVDTAKIPWNVSRVKSPELWNRTMGRGVKVAIIDTGIAKHPDLCIAGGVNTITGGSFQDDNGHGTHVAGIAAATGRQKIFGNAPKVKLFAVKVLDQNGNGFVSDIVEGIDWWQAVGAGLLQVAPAAVIPAAIASGSRFPSKAQRLKKAKSASRPVLFTPSGRSKR